MRTGIFSLIAALGVATCGLAAGADAPEQPYQLTIEADRVSLRATDASVVTLVEDLGRRLGFEVIAQGVSEARVTVDIEGGSLGETIHAICKRVGYVEVPDPETGRTVRLVLTPGARSVKNRLAARREPLPPRQKATPDPAPVPVRAPVPADKKPRPADDDDS